MRNAQTLDVVDTSRSLFQGLCGACPRRDWCSQTWRQQCAIPEDPEHAGRYWALQVERVRRVGGVAPKALPPVVSPPVLPKVTHILGREGRNPDAGWGRTMGVYARNALGDLRRRCAIRPDYLRARGLLEPAKVLVVSAEDGWLNRFCGKLGEPFARSVREAGFSAVIGPNLSAYPHAEHRVWLDNRAVCQLVMEFSLGHGLPAVFHTYLEDSAIHQDWLVEYLRLNPTQEFLATGFDCMGGNNVRFVRRRVRMLERVQDRAGRPMRIVLHNVLSRVRIAHLAHQAFPGRVHLLGRSVLLRSLKGSRLEFDAAGRSSWVGASSGHVPGLDLFRQNACRLDDALADVIPGFFD
jgi:hypothetical protein